MKEIHITMYTKDNCPNCVTAKLILDSVGLKYADVDIMVGERMANFIKVLDLVKYDPEKGCFVLKDNKPTRALNPWEELRLVKRPSIFATDPRFRAKTSLGTVQNEEGLGYKQFGTYTRAKERQPNKHEGVLEHATAKATRATTGKTSPDV